MQDLPLTDCFWPVTAAEAQTSFAVDDDKERKEEQGRSEKKRSIESNYGGKAAYL